MKSWAEEYATTWLSQPVAVTTWDGWVRKRLGAHRPDAEPEAVAPWTVDRLTSDVRRLGDERAWLWCTAAVVLLAELMFCADAGAPFPAHDTGHRYDLDRNVRSLRVVRNAVFHPAFQSGAAGSGTPPIELLYVELDNHDDDEVRKAALRLSVDWSYLGARPITSYALRTLDSAGRLYAQQLGIG